MPSCLLALASFLALLSFGPPAWSQVEETDLPPDTFSKLTYEGLSQEELEAQFDQAEQVFLQSPDPAAAVPKFSELIDILEKRSAAGAMAQADQALLARSIDYRTRINFNLGLSAEVDRDLERLLDVDPAYVFDPALVSPKLLERYASLKKRLTGQLLVKVEPADSEVSVNGLRVDPAAGPVVVREGPQKVSVRRPGFSPVDMDVEVAGGRSLPLELTLERESAMLLLVSRPAGATVLVDGQAMGTTTGTLPSDYPLTGEAARHPREEFSAPLRIGGIRIGGHRIEVQKQGHRTYGFSVDVPELKDYNAGIALLQLTQGTVLLRKLPASTHVTVNGKEVRPAPVNTTDGRLTLPPGDYRLGVADGTTGFFEATFNLADQQTVELEVKLRPALTLLGILGGDRPAARRLFQGLTAGGGDLEGWTLLERTEQGEELLSRLGFEAAVLRLLASRLDGGEERSVDWGNLQKEADKAAPGSVYLVAALSDDLLATEADLWFLPTAPAPATPDRRRIRLDDDKAIPRLVQALNRPFEFQRAWFGALLIDSTAADGPVVADLNPESPAALAGVRVGDVLLSIFGERVTSATAAQRILSTLRPDSSFSVELGSAAGRRTLDVKLGRSPAVAPLESRDLIYAAISASVANASRDPETTTPAWLLQLNQAAVFLHGGAWKDAVRVLRGIQAPNGPGLGQAAVNYWLGTALRAIGPEYHDQARVAFEAAAAVPGARLFHNDGPLVAPRARARLQALGSP